MQQATIVFCTSVSLATLAVILLSLLSPFPAKNHNGTNTIPWVDLSLYIQQPNTPTSNTRQVIGSSNSGALIFHRTLTEGPESTSKVVGKAQGFIIPIEHFAHSDFNLIYLTFDTPEYSGSLSVQAKKLEGRDREELAVVGGTGSFAFARGLALLAETGQGGLLDKDGTYHVKLQLRLPNSSRTIPG